ncbi:glutaredoxin family protein [Propionicicella superfundia]|uniref:glutaredoxin family protein n=1 Tax=Propionicicella superfundia TaxID=348582 RepID=UPI001B7FCBB6|nr:glutaredoxin family protein [Propionicicella superfundia]
MTEPRRADRAVPAITLITSPGCHLCDDAHRVLATLADERRIVLGTVDAESPEGETVVAAHRPSVFPLVLLDGAYFSAGRLPRRKLAAALGLDRSVA